MVAYLSTGSVTEKNVLQHRPQPVVIVLEFLELFSLLLMMRLNELKRLSLVSFSSNLYYVCKYGHNLSESPQAFSASIKQGPMF
jgi:hypothetical protein